MKSDMRWGNIFWQNRNVPEKSAYGTVVALDLSELRFWSGFLAAMSSSRSDVVTQSVHLLASPS